MHSKHIDVSYFAAGIVAHLASEGEWTVETISEEEMTNDLVSTLFVIATNIACHFFFHFQQRVVCEWRTPKEEMVAYRSFRPFFPLMGVNQPKAVQLWAVWAVHHVCSKNREHSISHFVVTQYFISFHHLHFQPIGTVQCLRIKAAMRSSCN